MSASFTLTLDTHAPTIAWGEPEGTEASAELVVPYTIDESGVVSASVRLADGRNLPMAVGPTELTVTLPADTPNGTVLVSALVRDDVLNEATRTLAFHVGGVVVPPAPAPTVDIGEVPRGPRRNLLRIRSTASSTTRVSIRATHPRTRSRANARSAIRVERRVAAPTPPPRPDPRRPPNHHRFQQTARAVSTTRIHTSTRHGLRAAAHAHSTVVVRKADDELAVLLLLLT